jgi:hypothetical protein
VRRSKRSSYVVSQTDDSRGSLQLPFPILRAVEDGSDGSELQLVVVAIDFIDHDVRQTAPAWRSAREQEPGISAIHPKAMPVILTTELLAGAAGAAAAVWSQAVRWRHRGLASERRKRPPAGAAPAVRAP